MVFIIYLREMRPGTSGSTRSQKRHHRSSFAGLLLFVFLCFLASGEHVVVRCREKVQKEQIGDKFRGWVQQGFQLGR